MPRFTPRALIFDMDGLMVDSEPLWFAVERAFAASRGADWTADHAAACVGRGTAHTLRTMSATFGFPVDIPRDTEALIDSLIARVSEIPFKPGCPELLTAAEKLPLAVASSSPARLIHAILDHFSIRPLFTAIVSGQDIQDPKPAPDIFLRAAELLRTSPPHCAVLEDSLAGATAAHAAQTHVIAIPEDLSKTPLYAPVADVILPSLHAARDYLDLPE